jgi:hypothetical protein
VWRTLAWVALKATRALRFSAEASKEEGTQRKQSEMKGRGQRGAKRQWERKRTFTDTFPSDDFVETKGRDEGAGHLKSVLGIPDLKGRERFELLVHRIPAPNFARLHHLQQQAKGGGALRTIFPARGVDERQDSDHVFQEEMPQFGVCCVLLAGSRVCGAQDLTGHTRQNRDSRANTPWCRLVVDGDPRLLRGPHNVKN